MRRLAQPPTRHLAQRAERGDVVGMGMRVDRDHQAKRQRLDQREVARGLRQHRIDQQVVDG